jgi:ribosomal protein S18 acetylase RimI-like enzyme
MLNSNNFNFKFQNLKKENIFDLLTHIEQNAKTSNIEYPKERINFVKSILDKITNSSEKGFAFVAKDKDEKIISSGIVDFFRDFKNKNIKNGEVMGIYTSPNYQNMGISSFMLKNLIKFSKYEGCKNLFLYTKNDKAKHLYKKLGFEQILPNEYNGRVIMKLES